MVHGGGSRRGASLNDSATSAAPAPTSRITTTTTTSSTSTTRRIGGVGNGGIRAPATTTSTSTGATSTSGSGGGTRNTTRPTSGTSTTPTSTRAASNGRSNTGTTQATRPTQSQPRQSRSTVHHGSGSGPTPIPATRIHYNSSIGRNTRRVSDPTQTTHHHHQAYNNSRQDLEEPLIIRPRAEPETEPEPEPQEGPNCCHGCACLCCLTSLSCLVCFLAPLRMAYQNTKSFIPAVILAPLIFGILLIFSGYRQTWTLNAGESRQILTSWFTHKVGVQILTPHTTVQVDLYTIKGACPPLTGPLVELHHQHEMTFGPGDYQYDYFFLNKGSRVEAGLTQFQGQSLVYMMKGQDKVAILQEPHHDNPDWLDNLLSTARSSWTVHDYANQVMARFRSDQNDVYTLLYDNPYNQNGHLLLDLWLDLTTYKLDAYTPVCADLAFHYCPPIPVPTFYSSCIILDTSALYGQGEVVQIIISEYRDYRSILSISFLPFFVLLVCKIYYCIRKTPISWRRDHDDEDYTTETPAASSPHEATPQPSAPPSTQDAGASIPLATAHLVGPDEDASNGNPFPSAPVEPIAAPTNEKN